MKWALLVLFRIIEYEVSKLESINWTRKTPSKAHPLSRFGSYQTPWHNIILVQSTVKEKQVIIFFFFSSSIIIIIQYKVLRYKYLHSRRSELLSVAYFSRRYPYMLFTSIFIQSNILIGGSKPSSSKTVAIDSNSNSTWYQDSSRSFQCR